MARLAVGSAAEIEQAVAAAVAARQPLAIEGLGSRKGLGRPVAAETVLDTSALTGIIDYEPEELVLVAKPATPLSTILTNLDQAGQMLAFDPPWGSGRADRAMGSIGGVIACNLAGPRRLVAGAARDYLLGFKAVSGRGEAFQSGSRVMKNVTGYDLPKLIAGSFGTLAVMHEITLKTMPKPQSVAALVIAVPDLEAAGLVMREAFASPHEPAAASALPAEAAIYSSVAEMIGAEGSTARVLVVLRLEGPRVSVKHRCQALADMLAPGCERQHLTGRQADRLHGEIREVALLAAQDNRVLWKISCPPASGPTLLAGLMQRPHSTGFLDWAGGLLWLSHPASGDGGAAAIRQQLDLHGGHAMLYKAEEKLRHKVAVFQPQPPALAGLSARIKASFDPLGILNPGRMYATDQGEG